jgi:uncharacterized tellurite resistance protein B-like protein
MSYPPFFNNPYRDELNNKQKRAIIGALIIISLADSETNPQEQETIDHIISLMGVNMEDPFFKVIASMHEITESLKTLTKKKQEWLLSTMYVLICEDGEPCKNEIEFLTEFARDMNIKKIELEQIINDTNLRYK